MDRAGKDAGAAGISPASTGAAGTGAVGMGAAGVDRASTDAVGMGAAGVDRAGTDAASTDAASTDAVGTDAVGMGAAGVDTASAYRHCEDVVRSQARNFSYGIRLLPAPKRRALSAVYAFARRVDDIGDDHGAPAADRLAKLARERARLADLDAHPSDPVLVALADAARRHPIPLDAFEELIDGCEADVRGRDYDTFDDLLWYCRCVAGAVGRLSLGVFGTSDPGTAVPRADALGVALQLTNILRDVKEDGENGRVYLPAKDLARFGCTLERDASGRLADPPERLVSLIRFEASRAAEWYGTGLKLLPMLDRRSAACAGAMAGIYRRLLKRIAADPVAALETRTSLPAWEKATVSARAMSGLHL